jgi:hypothetical protein
LHSFTVELMRRWVAQRRANTNANAKDKGEGEGEGEEKPWGN